MIESYTGLIGGGKTYTAVLRMLKYISTGGCVVSNIKLKLDPWNNTHKLFKGIYKKDLNAMGVKVYLKKFLNWEYQEGQYRYIDNSCLSADGITKKLPVGLADLPVLVVWDEGADFWDSEERKTADREFLSLLRHSRKLSIDFIFIIQEFTELNKRIRNQVSYVWRFIDMKSFRVPGLKLSMGWIPMLNNQIRVLQFNRGQYEHNKNNIEAVYSGWVDKKQEVFSCFQTDALHVGVNVLFGESIDFRNKGKISKRILSNNFCFFIGFCFLFLMLILGGII